MSTTMTDVRSRGLLQIRCEPSWLRWLDRAVAQERRTGRSDIVDAALAEYARSRGIPPPPIRV